MALVSSFSYGLIIPSHCSISLLLIQLYGRPLDHLTVHSAICVSNFTVFSQSIDPYHLMLIEVWFEALRLDIDLWHTGRYGLQSLFHIFHTFLHTFQHFFQKKSQFYTFAHTFSILFPPLPSTFFLKVSTLHPTFY